MKKNHIMIGLLISLVSITGGSVMYATDTCRLNASGSLSNNCSRDPSTQQCVGDCDGSVSFGCIGGCDGIWRTCEQWGASASRIVSYKMDCYDPGAPTACECGTNQSNVERNNINGCLCYDPCP